MSKFQLNKYDLEDIQDWLGSGEAIDPNRLSKIFSNTNIIGEYDEH